MDGDIAPLPPLVELSEKYGAMMMVDDAHGEGVLGKGGRGAVDHFGMHGRVDVEIGTLSKAFGVVGGVIAGKKAIIDYIRQKARPFLFSSATRWRRTLAIMRRSAYESPSVGTDGSGSIASWTMVPSRTIGRASSSR